MVIQSISLELRKLLVIDDLEDSFRPVFYVYKIERKMFDKFFDMVVAYTLFLPKTYLKS